MTTPPDDAAFVEGIAALSAWYFGNKSDTLLISVEDRDRLVALARDRETWKVHAKAVEGNLKLHAQEITTLRRQLADAEVEAKRFRKIFTESLGNCSTDYTDFQMAVCGAEGWRIRATDAEARVREVEEAAQGVLERGCACADYGESARETEAAWTRLVVALARRTT